MDRAPEHASTRASGNRRARRRALALALCAGSIAWACSDREGAVDGEAVGETQPKVLIIGLDGGDQRWVDRLAKAGRLPHLGGLMERGVSGRLETVHYASPIIWTSIATGVRPERHGIGGFMAGAEPDPEADAAPRQIETATGRKRPVTVAQRRRPALWNILSHYGRSVGVLAWWATYPAETVNGYVVSPYLIFLPPKKVGTARVNVDWSSDDPGKTYPPELGEELAPMMYAASDLQGSDLAAVMGTDKQTPYTPWGLARDKSYFEATRHVLETRPVDCVATYFQGIDVASHDFTYYVFGRNLNEKRKPRVPPREVIAAYARVEAMYERMDALVGGLLERTSDDTNVIVVSDHGWEYDGTSHWNLNPGMFVAAGPGFVQGARAENVSVLDITPIALALLDVPLARAFDGHIPDGVLRTSVTERVGYVDDYPIPAVAVDFDAQGAVPEEERMVDLLKGLGYVE